MRPTYPARRAPTMGPAGRAGFLGLLLAGALAPGSPAGAADDAYARLLRAHVRPATIAGMTIHAVDYAALKADPDLPAALATAAAARPEALDAQARLAFWVNAYNLLALKAVVDRYPTASIRDGGGLFTTIWKTKIAPVAGRPRSLDEVEHEILRREFREPRIHFAIVCASLSCPDLRPEPYTGEALERQLDDATRRFLADPRRGLRLDAGRAAVSSIFKWFREDFQASGGVLAFVRAHADPAGVARLAAVRPEDLAYLDYDWSLNDLRRAR